MFSQFKIYIYGAIVLIVLSIFGYVSYVFHDRKVTKEKLNTANNTIETVQVETDLTAIASEAKGKIDQIDKRKKHEADTSIGTHQHTF